VTELIEGRLINEYCDHQNFRPPKAQLCARLACTTFACGCRLRDDAAEAKDIRGATRPAIRSKAPSRRRNTKVANLGVL